MARRRINTTKYEIIRTGTQLFLEKGYSATTPKRICEELNISTGNLTYYFPTKEHLLAVLVEMLCTFQYKTMQDMVQEEGTTSLLAVCLELAAMASMSEESQVAKEFYLASYTSPLCLEIIRKNDAKRSCLIYGKFCPEWEKQRYIEAEALVSGIEYATIMTTEDSVGLEERITCALDNIMKIYNVPEDTRSRKINQVLAMDYRALGCRILSQFKEFVEQTNEQAVEMLLSGDQD